MNKQSTESQDRENDWQLHYLKECYQNKMVKQHISKKATFYKKTKASIFHQNLELLSSTTQQKLQLPKMEMKM